MRSNFEKYAMDVAIYLPLGTIVICHHTVKLGARNYGWTKKDIHKKLHDFLNITLLDWNQQL
jgi:hypothetical protein